MQFTHQDDCKRPSQADGADYASVDLCWSLFLEKRRYESLLPDLGSFAVLRGTDSSCDFREGGHLI